MAITYYTEEVRLPSCFKKRTVSQWIHSVATAYGKKTGSIAYLFCSDAKILEVNRLYLQHDYYTDIITFDYTEDDVLSGDLYISLDTVRSNAEQFRTDCMEELFRVVIHGVLHLCGLRDKTPEEQAEMSAAENRALALLLPPLQKNQARG